ncbi:hypothetical protein TSMG0041 [Halocynthia phage JM-2012]|uniref:hypothetical protein n=1 Tax=Halocynthia phage JM-2012 TaxID=1173297 RepID=UPI00025C68F8|nr:hypothetical protein TSMG0041 [Halocynthia phage JM-2012]AFI55324.1 hypothetical protein TSMG0041 [Halocynthia phage JM-2012]
MTIIVRDDDGLFYSDTKVTLDDLNPTYHIKYITMNGYVSVVNPEDKDTKLKIPVSGFFCAGYLTHEFRTLINGIGGDVGNYLADNLDDRVNDIKVTIVLVTDTDTTYTLHHDSKEGWLISTYDKGSVLAWGDPNLFYTLNETLTDLSIQEVLLLMFKLELVDSVGGDLILVDPKNPKPAVINIKESEKKELYSKFDKAMRSLL